MEIPCIKRNASGVAGAFVAAEMALAGIDSAIPADEVIWSMKRIGDVMSPTLKETAEGGLAATPTGRKLHDQVFVLATFPADAAAVPAVIHKFSWLSGYRPDNCILLKSYRNSCK